MPFGFWSRGLFGRKPELVFLGDQMLVEKACRELTGDDHIRTGSLRMTRPHLIQILGRRPIIATFQPLEEYSELQAQIHEITASRSVDPLIVVLYDINMPIDIPKTFVDEACTFDGSILWLTGLWNPDRVGRVTEPGDTSTILNLQQKKKELELRNVILKPSLKRGARYSRWSAHDDSGSLRIPLKELVENKHSKQNLVRSQKKSSFKFTDADTGEEIWDPLELSEDDFIIAVMGPTGAGKSTFIKNGTGYDLRIGDELESCTSEIHIIRVTSGNSRIYIIDTPGFNDTNRSDLEIFKLISEWLRQRFTNQVYLSGLVYLHRISDNRMAGTTLKNLKIFEELCGKDCFHKITLATTMWDDVETIEIGTEREKQLEDDYFSAMRQRGADLKRLLHTPESAKELLEFIISNAKEMRPLSLQKELVALQRELPFTKAGRKMYDKLDEVLQAHEAALSQLNRDIRAEKSDQVRLILSQEREALNQELLALIADMQYMQLPLPTRLLQQVKQLLGLNSGTT